MRKSSILVLIGVVLTMCTAQTDQEGVYTPEGLDRRDLRRYEQYLVEGQKLYKTHCGVCHGMKGEGMAQLYPPLAKADYFLKNIPRAACIIRKGLKGETIVNGVDYTMEMPAMSDLGNLQIAEIITYVGNNWGNEAGFTTVKQVNKYITDCDSY